MEKACIDPKNTLTNAASNRSTSTRSIFWTCTSWLEIKFGTISTHRCIRNAFSCIFFQSQKLFRAVHVYYNRCHRIHICAQDQSKYLQHILCWQYAYLVYRLDTSFTDSLSRKVLFKISNGKIYLWDGIADVFGV